MRSGWARCDWGYVSGSNEFRESWMRFTYAAGLINSWPGRVPSKWNTHALYRRLTLDSLALIRFKFRPENWLCTAIATSPSRSCGASEACGQWVFCVPLIRALFCSFRPVPCSFSRRFFLCFAVSALCSALCLSLPFSAFYCALGSLLDSVCLPVCVWPSVPRCLCIILLSHPHRSLGLQLELVLAQHSSVSLSLPLPLSLCL